MKNLPTTTLLVLASCTTFNTQADNKLEEIIIISSRVETPLREVATSVSAITREDIDVRGFSGVANVLRYEPGISVTNNGGAGKATSLSIRGERGFRTKVFIDGIDVTDISTPQSGPNFANMTSAGIERIEILRGPQGLMYGADAGGVVNINTRRPEPGFSGDANAEFGRYGTQQYAGNVYGGSETVDFSLSGSRFDTDGFNALTTDTVLRDDDGYKNTTFHGRAGWNFTDTLRAELVGRTVEGDNDYDDCFTVDTFERTDNCTSHYDQDAWRGALIYQGDIFTHNLSYNENSTDRDFDSAGQRSFSADGELQKIEYLGSWNPSRSLHMVYGVDLQKESLDSGAFDPDRDQEGYYLEYQGSFADSIYLTAGARYTDNDDFGTKTTYRLSAAYLIPAGDGEAKFKGTYGTGFRAPSLYEIAYNGGPFAFPPASDTELDAEESKGYDLGVGYYANSGWYVDVVYFDQRIDDEIFFDLINFSGYLQGHGESTSKGVELITEVPLGEILALTGNYTYNDTEDSEGEQRLRAPEHMANLGLILTPWNERLTIGINWRIARDTAEEIGGDIDDYEVLDLSTSYRIMDALVIYGRVENITDEDYQEIPNYNTAGAAGYAGLRYTF